MQLNNPLIALPEIPEDILNTNEILNCMDPGKDLNVNGASGQRIPAAARPVIEEWIKELFLRPGSDLPEGYLAVGDTKAAIIRSVELRYGNYLEAPTSKVGIVRAKHSSGNDSRPDGLHYIQDNGSIDLVANVKMVIHPGTVLDPAGKTKQGAYLNFFESPEDVEYMTLGDYYLKRIVFSFDDEEGTSIGAVRGEITARKEPGKYVVTIPVEGETIVGEFDPRTFKTLAGSEAFEGNPEKNDFIRLNYANPAQANACKARLLCKESGDTLQVGWLELIFDINERAQAGGGVQRGGGSARARGILRENTTVGTTDTVVKYRCITNGVSCIHTDQKGNSIFFSPRVANAAQQVAINRSLILNTVTTLSKHNESILAVLQTIVATVPTGDASVPWINNISWNQVQRNAAVRLLRDNIDRLKAFQLDRVQRLNAMPDPEDAKLLAAKAMFVCPFVWYKNGGYFKTINSVNSFLLDGTFKFTASKFTPTIVTSQSAYSLLRGGARTKAMAKGYHLKALPVEYFAIYNTPYDNTSASAIQYQAYLTTLNFLNLQYLRREDFSVSIPDTGSRDIAVFTANVRTDALGRISLPNGFLYCYIVQYYPEIFLYADVIKEAAEKNDIFWPAMPESFNRSLRAILEGDYEYDADLRFVINDARRFDDAMDPMAIKAIAFAELFLSSYPQLYTTSVLNFLQRYRAVFAGELNQEQAAFPNLLEYPKIVFDAMDLYEIEYVRILQNAYTFAPTYVAPPPPIQYRRVKKPMRILDRLQRSRVGVSPKNLAYAISEQLEESGARLADRQRFLLQGFPKGRSRKFGQLGQSTLLGLSAPPTYMPYRLKKGGKRKTHKKRNLKEQKTRRYTH